ncbi:MAG: HAMP domain-containing histidine kinase [Oscillospiraceae bacterium]|nr:HAMP domain-containing histidine kinase [Oscillospiraceae bacterium]
MWNRITLRAKITLLTALALSVVATFVTGLSIYNARQITFLPRGEGTVTITQAVAFPRHFDSASLRIFMHPDALFGTDTVQIVSSPTHLHNMSGWHISGQDALAELSQSQSDFQTHSILIALGAVLLGTLAAYVISGQALKPIKSLAERIEDVDANNLNQLIAPPNTIDEVARLTYSFNNMLGKLNRSFEAQKLFAQNAAHELKTPLASMRANIEVLQMDTEPSIEEYREVVGVVKDSTERLIALVEGLLFLDNRTDDRAQLFSSRDVFEKILDDLQEDIVRKNLDISIEGDCQIRGDRALLERAFSNLVHNAIRYNVDGGTVKVRLAAEGITIADSGVGIPAAHLAHIFEPFYCVDQSRSKDLGGHGLGLAIAKNIFDKHHIAIQVSSACGKGTTIVLQQ